MYRRIADFIGAWDYEKSSTQKILDRLTDASLAQQVSPGGRSLGRLAWHVVVTIPEMMRHAGLALEGGLADDAPIPAHAAQILEAYAQEAARLAELLPSSWTDAMLDDAIPMYGESWKRGQVLASLVAHQAHHRGQMTVLMRQAGLRVPGIYGPSKEEWADYGMPPQD